MSALVITSNLLIPLKFQGNPPHAVPVLFLEPDQVNKVCGTGTKIDSQYVYYACEVDKTGLVIMPNPCKYPEYKNPDSYARLMCHEKAHVMGWDHAE